MPGKRKRLRRAERQATRRAERQANRAEQRARAQYKPAPKPPGAPAAPAAPKYGPLMQRAQRDAQLRYGDQMLRAQAQVNNAGAWFDQYKMDVAKRQQATADRYAAAQQALTVPVQGPAVQSPEGDQAAASRQVLQQAQQNALQSQGQAQQDYFAGRGTVGSAAQLQARQQATSQVNQLATEKDTYALSRRDELRDQRHRRRLENAAFNLDVGKAQSDAADDAITTNQWGYTKSEWAAMSPKARQRIIRRQKQGGSSSSSTGGDHYGYTDKQWKGMSPAARRKAYKDWQDAGREPDGGGKSGGKSPFTATQQSEARRKIRAAYRTVKKNDPGPGNKDYWKNIYDAMVDADVDPLIARVAIQSYRGNIGPNVAKALFRDYGVRVKPKRASRPSDSDFGADDYSKGAGRPD